MQELLTLAVDPGIETDPNQLREYAIMGGGILIFTALVIFTWRILNDKAKFTLIVVGLALFFIFFVIRGN